MVFPDHTHFLYALETLGTCKMMLLFFVHELCTCISLRGHTAFASEAIMSDHQF